MKWSDQDRIRLAFWVLPFVPFLLCFLFLSSSRTLMNSAESVAHTNEVVRKLKDLASDVKDVQVAQREFILTGDDSMLQNYQGSKKIIIQMVGDLKKITAEKEYLKAPLSILDSVLSEKFDEMEKTVELRRTEGVEAASQVIIANRGKQAMDDIQKLLRQMINAEDNLLGRREWYEQASFVRTVIIFGIALALNFTFVWLMAFMLKRDGQRRVKEEQRIRDLNAELEMRVEQRTEALQRSNDDLQQFAYIASHDLQEPLRMVASYTELLRKRYHSKLDADADEFIGYTIDGVRRMSTLIQDLLAYSRAGETPEGSQKVVQSESALQNALTNLKARIEDAEAEVTFDPLPAAKADPMRLTQLFQNLIGNAIKYRGTGKPVVHVSGHMRGKEIAFAVQDNGIGIEPQYQDQIFGIFKRLHGREYEGTGIGLAMCKKIVERQGGRIWVESEPNKGSTFWFTLPAPESGPASIKQVKGGNGFLAQRIAGH